MLYTENDTRLTAKLEFPTSSVNEELFGYLVFEPQHIKGIRH